MVQNSDIAKIAFTKRLHEALDALPECPLGHGRAAWLSRHVPFSVSPKATGKWLNKESIPTRENMRLLAISLKVNKAWLSDGEGVMKPAESGPSPRTQEFLRLFEASTPEEQEVYLRMMRGNVAAARGEDRE